MNFQKCAKCKKNIDISKFDIKFDDVRYSTCINCRAKGNEASRLSYHLNKSINKCHICEHTCKIKKNLNLHLWYIHDIGEGKIFNCSVEGCEYTTKIKGNLNSHLWQIHDIGEKKILNCPEKDCEHTCKNKSNLIRHLLVIHDIGEEKIFNCSEKDCEFTTKSKSNLIRHLWESHDIGEKKIFNCSVKGCEYTSKSKCHLTRHLTLVHDIGDKECSICIKNVSKTTDFIDPKTNEKINGCRECYKKIIGYSTRVEKQMVEYLERNEKLKPYIILKDKILKGGLCNTKCRPDLLIGTPGLSIIVECDENQHKYTSYDKSCELSRMDALMDELQETRTIFIRWNPDYYKKDGKRLSKNRKERLESLEKLIFNILEDNVDKNILVYYMYYDKDNDKISQRHPISTLYG